MYGVECGIGHGVFLLVGYVGGAILGHVLRDSLHEEKWVTVGGGFVGA